MSPFTIKSVGPRSYAFYTPPGYPGDGNWPLILFLHGAGESGDDPLTPTSVGLGPALRRHPDRYPAVVVLPQFPWRSYWEGRPLQDAMNALEQTVGNEKVDEQRTYLTGVSMGGFGAFALAALNPRRFAAVAPICGGGRPDVMATALREVPLWVFHGGKDDVVPVEYSRQMVAAVRRAGGKEVRYTEYPDVGHNSWDPAYDEPELPAWLFEHRLPL